LNPLAPLYRFADRVRYRKHGNLGQHGEDLAHRYLRRHGFTVTARHWMPPQGGGEIDIVAWEGDVLVFVEVKARSSAEWGEPERGINADKMTALRRTARDYMRRAGIDPYNAPVNGLAEVRFDVISIVGGSLRHLRDAFPMTPSL